MPRSRRLGVLNRAMASSSNVLSSEGRVVARVRRAQNCADLCLRRWEIGIRKDIPHAQIGQLRIAHRGNGAERFLVTRMVIRCRQKGLRIGTALREGGDKQQSELPSLMHGIIFPLSHTRVVQLKICEIRCGVARQTVADASLG